VELVRNRKTKEPAGDAAERVLNVCKDKGLLIGRGGLYSSTLRIQPPLIVSVEQADEAARIFDEALGVASKEFARA
jgi:4-aminobutyrate aminotransferase-like enzyme